MASRLDAFKGTDSPERTALKAAVKTARDNASKPKGMVASTKGGAGTAGMVAAKDVLGAGLAAGAASAILDHKAKQKKALADAGA